MPEKTRTRSTAEAQYCDLIRLAYLVLPGKGRRVQRLAVARRIVDGVVTPRTRFGLAGGRPCRSRGAGERARRRTRVLRTAMRPSRRLNIGLGPWLRALPARLPDPALTAALARLDPPVRVAYVLREIEGVSRYGVRDQLADLHVRNPWEAIEAAEAADVPEARRTDTFEPALIRPVRRRSPLPFALAGVLTALLVAALVVTENDGSRAVAGREPRLVTAAPGAWTRGSPTFDAWPARGDLAADGRFVRRALDAWTSAAGPDRAAAGRVQLLYAGRAGGAPAAVLRQGDRIARYRGATGGLEVVRAGTDPAGPVALGGGRYLLSPWDVRPATPAGRPIATRHGVTDPVDAGTRCGRGPLLHLTGRGGTRTVGDLGGPRAAVLVHRSPAAAPAAEPAAPARLTVAGLALWRRLGCLLPPPGRPVAEAAASDFWSGPLPHGGGEAAWVCARMAFDGGGSAGLAALLLEDEQHATGACDDRRPVSGTWWYGPSGRWYYLAAAGRGLLPHAEGPLGPVEVDGRLLTAAAPDPRRRPAGAVTLTARADARPAR